VTLSKDPHPSNADFPHGSCNDAHAFGENNTGCGWITTADEKTYYIEPNANLKTTSLAGENLTGVDLTGANLTDTNLSDANLSNANLTKVYLNCAILRGVNLTGANMTRVWRQAIPSCSESINSSTICPNGKPWGIGGGGNCPF
jgi:uncharacterized protein YjbI with pentapeptide repeats